MCLSLPATGPSILFPPRSRGPCDPRARSHVHILLASNTVISAALPKASRSRPANDAPDGPPPTMPTDSASAPTEEWRRIHIIAWRCKIVDGACGEVRGASV